MSYLIKYYKMYVIDKLMIIISQFFFYQLDYDMVITKGPKLLEKLQMNYPANTKNNKYKKL